MAASDKLRSIADTILQEGGYSNDAGDPGGPTDWGITIKDARNYWKAGATAADVRDMPREVAESIYQQQYWAPIMGDDLPAGVDFAVFDYGVNSGIARSIALLRHLLGLKVSAEMDASVVAAAAKADPNVLIDEICDERMKFLRSIGTWPEFGRGWTSRVSFVRRIAHKMVADAKPQPKKDVIAMTQTTVTEVATTTAASAPVNSTMQTIDTDVALGLQVLSSMMPTANSILALFPSWGPIVSLALQVVYQAGTAGLNAVHNVMQAKSLPPTPQGFMSAYAEYLGHISPDMPDSPALSQQG